VRRTVEMTDRGVYEDLGLRHFVLGDRTHTAHAHDLDYVMRSTPVADGAPI
jgi:hypothetical protein